VPAKELSTYRRIAWIEGSLLLAVTFFLLFPTLFIAGTILALLLVMGIWLSPLALKPRSLIPVTPFNIALLFWSLTLIVGILVTADPDLALPKATSLILGLVVWRYLAWSRQERQWLGWGMLGFVLLGLGFTVVGALSANWLSKVPVLTDIVGLFPVGALAFLEAGTHPNELAGTILVYFPLLLSLLIGWRPQRLYRAALVSMILLIIGTGSLLVLTQSRSGWLGGLGSFFLLLLFWGVILPRSSKRRVVWLGLAVFSVVLATSLALIGPERLQVLWEEPPRETAIGTLTSLNFRREVWQWAIAGIKEFPFTGSGLGSFRRVVVRLYPINLPPDYDIAHAHNIFFQVALDVGLPGLIAYLALLMLAGTVAWQVARQDEALRPFALGLLAGLAGLHIYGLTDALAPGAKPGLLFWAALGLLAAMRRIQQA
jgi:putative inorganic carbon (HCO3(-)) transporter